MKCLDCGSTKLVTARGPHRYVESGLANVVLHDIATTKCGECGREDVVIPRMAQLHRTIAHALARKREKLEAAEIRFLRKFLGWSGADFAKHFGTRPATVSRWETGKQPMGGIAERLLRVAALIGERVDEYPMVEVALTGDSMRVGAKLGPDGWSVDLAVVEALEKERPKARRQRK